MPNGPPIEGEPGRILDILKRKTKTCIDWEEGEPSKGKLKEAMEKLKQRIGLAILEKLKKMEKNDSDMSTHLHLPHRRMKDQESWPQSWTLPQR